MTAIADMITAVRKDLHDEDAAAYRWTDAHLTRHIERAVAEISEVMPLEAVATVVTTNASRIVDVSAVTGIVGILAVEYPVGNWPRTFVQFEWYGGVLTLITDLMPTGDNCTVYYTKVQSIGATQTFGSEVNHSVALGAAAYAALEWASWATNRINADPTAQQRYGVDGERWLGEFNTWLARKRRKVGVRRLYTPTEPEQSKTTDWGPS